MQNIVDALRKRGKLYKRFLEISPKDLGIRNKIKIFHATDLKGYFWAILVINQKSRLLMKDVEKYNSIFAKLVQAKEHNFKHKVLFIDAPLCSKAKIAFKNSGWKLY
jgi:hypothetical protein